MTILWEFEENIPNKWFVDLNTAKMSSAGEFATAKYVETTEPRTTVLGRYKQSDQSREGRLNTGD
jgi:hypothetical protein